MSSHPFENVASIQITDESGAVRNASAIVHQDPQYLHANRISLIGTRQQELDLLSFGQDGIIEWRYHSRPDWKLSDDPEYSYIQRGTGVLRPTGTTHGVMIAEDSIQPFAEIEIIKAIDEVHSKGTEALRSEYWFLQRPKEGWYVNRRSWSRPAPATITGPWTRISSLGLRFRLLSISTYRDDDRITQERERLDLPGVEIEPIGSMEEATFFEAAEGLWFSFRVLLAFRYRQALYTLAEFRNGPRRHEAAWHSVRLEPRYRRGRHEAFDPPFRARLEKYLARGAARLAHMAPQRELLHAAAFGYATSYSSVAMESRHTACVEGIERLVEAFEQVSSLTRERIDKTRWRALGRQVRRQARTIEATPSERRAIDRALSELPRLHLLERIERMAKSLPAKWRKGPIDLLEGAGTMIALRNDIVHGRMISDYNRLMIEGLRAQTLFEALWLGFFDCGDLHDSGFAQFAIRHHVKVPPPSSP